MLMHRITLLDSWVKRGAELSSVHHLGVIWQKVLKRLETPKHIVRVYWE